MSNVTNALCSLPLPRFHVDKLSSAHVYLRLPRVSFISYTMYRYMQLCFKLHYH